MVDPRSFSEEIPPETVTKTGNAGLGEEKVVT